MWDINNSMNSDLQHIKEYKNLLIRLDNQDPEYHYKISPNLTSTPKEALEFRKKVVLERISILENQLI